MKLSEEKKKAGWQVVRFGDVAREVKATTSDPAADGLEYYVGLEHLDPQSLLIQRKGVIAEDNPTFTRLFKPGQILFGKRRAYQKKAAVADFAGICSGDILVMEALPGKIIPGLLPFIVQSDLFFDHAVKTSSGSLSPRTKWKSLAEFEFPLPPPARQKAILEVLEKVEENDSRIDQLLQSASQSLRIVRQSIFQNLGSQAGENETDVEQITLANAGKWLSGGTPSKSNSAYWDGDVPWFCPKDMKRINLTRSLVSVTFLGAKNGTKQIPANSLLVVVRGMILAHTFPVGITMVESTFNQDIKALLPFDNVHPRYLLQWFREKEDFFLSLVTTASHGTKRLSADVLFEAALPLPKLELQSKLVATLDSFDAIVDELAKKKRRSCSIRSTILGKLFT